MSTPKFTGGCLCGALRYESTQPPQYMGYCCCVDCRKASGSGFIPFAGFAAATLSITGKTLSYVSKAANGGDAMRNSCAVCASLVFGGPLGETDSHTLYVGSADDPSWFKPTIAIFARDMPAWVLLPEGIKKFDALPGDG